MRTEPKHRGTNAKIQKPNPEPTCMSKMVPFFANMEIYRSMAKQLQTDVDFLLALSSMESGWLDPHNQKLHNLFGVTNGGGHNLSFESYQKAADFWIKQFGPYVRGAKTMDAFANGLKKANYNVVNPNYYTHLKNQLGTIMRYKHACGIQ